MTRPHPAPSDSRGTTVIRHAEAAGHRDELPPARVRPQVRPLGFKEACAFIDTHHRHHSAPRGHKYSVGATGPDGALVAVAIVGRPIARHLDDGYTLEVTRLATTGAENGAANACSVLYSAAWRAARALGYRRILTYTQDGEHGASLRASGWQKVRDLPARTGWHTPARPRRDRGTDRIGRTRRQAELRPPHPPTADR